VIRASTLNYSAGHQIPDHGPDDSLVVNPFMAKEIGVFSRGQKPEQEISESFRKEPGSGSS